MSETALQTASVTSLVDRYPSTMNLEKYRGEWCVAYVKARHEKALARELFSLGVPYYLPLISKVHRRPDNNKPRKTIVPLFPCYVAFAGRLYRRLLYSTNRVCHVLEVEDQDRFIEELSAVDRICRVDSRPRLCDHVPVGQEVEIVRGPLRGVRGIVESERNRVILIVGVTLFHRYVMTLVDRVDLSPIS